MLWKVSVIELRDSVVFSVVQTDMDFEKVESFRLRDVRLAYVTLR